MGPVNRMQFSSWPADPSGISHAPLRDYDSALPGWLTPDPIGEAGGINLYGFVGNNPINYVDPYGLWGLGFLGGGSAETGVVYGGGGTMVAGGGLFGKGLRPSGTETFLSGGAFVGGPGLAKKAPKDCPQKPWALGGFAGAGLGPFITNAKNTGYGPGGLAGPFKQWNLNAGIGPIQFSASFAYNGGTWIGSITAGPGLGLNASGYPTETVPQSVP
jgi:RHS repeat-associated protein